MPHGMSGNALETIALQKGLVHIAATAKSRFAGLKFEGVADACGVGPWKFKEVVRSTA